MSSWLMRFREHFVQVIAEADGPGDAWGDRTVGMYSHYSGLAERTPFHT